MNKIPLIAITPSFCGGEYKLNRAYCDMVHAAGGAPSIVDYQYFHIAPVDGVIFSGGGDLMPDIGGYPSLPSLVDLCPERDQFERDLFFLALEKQIPILGICRGHQIINRFLGGTLYADINDAGFTEAHNTRDRHPILISEGSLLYNMLGERANVYSSHHQAVWEPGKGMRISAISPEGVCEAMEHESGRILTLQTHPERMRMQAPFDWLIKMASEDDEAPPQLHILKKT